MLPSSRTLKAETDFEKVKREGVPYQSNGFTLVIRKRNDGKLTRFGFIISNNVDKLAVHRNRVKRAMREACRQIMLNLEDGMDMLFIAKQPILSMTTEQIMKEIKDFLASTKFK